MNTKLDAIKAMSTLQYFMSRQQTLAVSNLIRGPERQFFIDILVELADRIKKMPQTYQQEGTPLDEQIVYLHYFGGGFDWYITEKDKGAESDENPKVQQQAFGLACMFDDEWGFISIQELIENGVELDFHLEPCSVKTLMGRIHP